MINLNGKFIIKKIFIFIVLYKFLGVAEVMFLTQTFDQSF